MGTESYKENIKKARDIASKAVLILLRSAGKARTLFLKYGMAIGAARRFVGHTRLWLKQRAQGHT